MHQSHLRKAFPASQQACEQLQQDSEEPPGLTPVWSSQCLAPTGIQAMSVLTVVGHRDFVVVSHRAKAKRYIVLRCRVRT